MDEEDIKRIARDGALGAAFVINFANALMKLRKAEERITGLRLTSAEVKAVMDGFRLLKEGRSK